MGASGRSCISNSNNQRRHRERVKCHIAELEARLAGTQLQLEKALARITDLSNQLLLSRTHTACLGDSMQVDDQGNSDDVVVTREDVAGLSPDTPCCVSCPVRESDNTPADRNGPSPVHHENGGTALQTTLLAEESTSQDDSDWSSSPMLSAIYTSGIMPEAPTFNYDGIAETGEQDCCDLLPPGPGESTTRCRDAYIMIAPQNYRGLEVSAMRGWLGPGFRGAIVKGDGCRVGTDLLFALLDFIS